MKILFVLLSSLFISFLLELVYRFFRHKKVIIPSPCSLTMYVLTGLLLYGFYFLKINIFYKIILIFVFTTGMEFMVGYLCKKYKSLDLWNYSNRRFNYRGLICLRFSIYWLLISLLYYFIVIPFLIKLWP